MASLFWRIQYFHALLDELESAVIMQRTTEVDSVMLITEYVLRYYALNEKA